MIAIGDISGKGVSTALIMSPTLSLLEDRMHQISDPGILTTTLNRQLSPRLHTAGLRVFGFHKRENPLRGGV